MTIRVASLAGGVGKTTSAIHLAAYLQTLAPTLLLDADPGRHATEWSRRGKPGTMLPFRVAPYSQAGQFVGDYAHVVIDGRRQSIFGDRNCEADTGEDNLLVVPVLPTFDTNSALATTAFLQELQNTPHRILFTRVPDEPSRNTVDMHEYLEQMGAPTFITQIPKLKVFERAALEGTTVKNISDSNSERAWTAYAAVGEEIVYQGQPLVN